MRNETSWLGHGQYMMLVRLDDSGEFWRIRDELAKTRAGPPVDSETECLIRDHLMNVLVDNLTAQRAERLLAADVGAFAEGMAALRPGSGAGQIELAGGHATFTGLGFFGNRAQGVGLHGPVAASALGNVERFFEERGLAAEYEVCPHADRSVIEGLADRGYVPVSFRNVYGHDRSSVPEMPTGIDVRAVRGAEVTTWSETLLDGFEYGDPARRERVALWNRMLAARPEATLLLASIDGRAVGAANVLVHTAGASLGGASTVPAARRQGVHRALVIARLRLAAERGCDFAIVTADPGGTAARNAQRVGFELLYTNVRLRRAADSRPHGRAGSVG